MTDIRRITAALCLTSSPRDMLVRWMMTSRVKTAGPGTCRIMGFTTYRSRKYEWCSIVRPHSKGTPWMTNFFSDQILLVTCSVFLPDSGRRSTPLWRTLRKCSFKWESERKIKVSSDFCGGQMETSNRKLKSIVWLCTSSVPYHPLHVPTTHFSAEQTTTKSAMEPR